MYFVHVKNEIYPVTCAALKWHSLCWVLTTLWVRSERNPNMKIPSHCGVQILLKCLAWATKEGI